MVSVTKVELNLGLILLEDERSSWLRAMGELLESPEPSLSDSEFTAEVTVLFRVDEVRSARELSEER